MKTIKFCLLFFCLSCLLSCGRVNVTDSISDRFSSDNTQSNLAEIATPQTIERLDRQLEKYTPQVKIIAPSQNKVFNRTDISIELEVKDLPIFKDDELKLGNHLNLILDNEAAQPIYNLAQPIVLNNITPGTHTIRVFASRPWGESFKNDGAYAQTTFSVLTETNDNRPDDNLPLLTYNSPTGSYSAEPILLDFYLTNAPLHSVAHRDFNLQDWRVKATVNGESFYLENWQPIYLTGFNRGENWIQLELVDPTDNNIENTFNNTVRVIDYNPEQSDTLAKLVTNKISLAQAQSIIEQNYYIQPADTPEAIELKDPLEPTVTSPESVKEPTIEDKTDSIKSVDSVSENSVPLTQEFKDNVSITEESEETIVTSEPELILQDSGDETEEVTVSDESEETITITEAESEDKPIAEIAIPEPESVEITDEEIAITIPEAESTPKSSWLKKILVSLRQKIESLVKLLPDEA